MNLFRAGWAVAGTLVLSVSLSAQGAKRAITFDDMIKLHRVSAPQISADGKWAAFAVSTPDMEANRNASNVWMVSTAGGEAMQVTQSGHDSSPAWSPDGKALAFLSSRDGNSQVYLLSMEGGEAKKLTTLSTGADLFQWAPDGKTIAFASAVYVDCKDDACNNKRDEEKEKSKVKARIYDHLLFRHWDHWSDGKRSHLFLMSVDGSASARDLTPAADYDIPPDQRGEVNDFAFSPDGKEICYTAIPDKMEAISTNGELFIVPVAGGEAKKITTNPGFDGNPVYSPDGQHIAYHAQLTAGYEADRWRVMLYDRKSGKSESISDGFDRSATNLSWSPDSKTIYFLAENETLQPVYAMEARTGATPKKVVDGYNSAYSFSADGKTLLTERTSLTMPGELFVAAGDGSGLKQLTHQNDAMLATLELNAPEKFWFEGAEGTKVEAMLVKPPQFAAGKKYPMLVLLHGGPQTMWSDAWGYRWNAEVFSAAGYVTLMINRRGSTGYGQKFTDEITNDWGGRAYTDVMKGIDAASADLTLIRRRLGGRSAAACGGWRRTDRPGTYCEPCGRIRQTDGDEELLVQSVRFAGTTGAGRTTRSGRIDLWRAGSTSYSQAGGEKIIVPQRSRWSFQGVAAAGRAFEDWQDFPTSIALKPQNAQLWVRRWIGWEGEIRLTTRAANREQEVIRDAARLCASLHQKRPYEQ
jgi:dipeptidyl aminopeptidase/acylaminoacyl peptidase